MAEFRFEVPIIQADKIENEHNFMTSNNTSNNTFNNTVNVAKNGYSTKNNFYINKELEDCGIKVYAESSLSYQHKINKTNKTVKEPCPIQLSCISVEYENKQSSYVHKLEQRVCSPAINKDAKETKLMDHQESSKEQITIVLVNEVTNERNNVDKQIITPVPIDKNTHKQLIDLVDKCLGEPCPVVSEEGNNKARVHRTISTDSKLEASIVIDTDTNKYATNHIDNNESTPIVIDEDSEKDTDCTIIGVDYVNSQKNNSMTSKDIYYFDELYKDNKLFTDIIEKCLDMENSAGMIRIINRTLVPMYRDANDAYKKSPSFGKVLVNTAINIDTEPDKKFSHIKSLCECLKLNIPKKRASLKTLKTNLNGKFSQNNTKFSSDEVPTKRKKLDVINLDDDDDDDDDVQIHYNNDPEMQIKITNVRGHVIDDDDNSGICSVIESNEGNGVTNGINQDDDVIFLDDESKCNKENETICNKRNTSPTSEVVKDMLLSNKTVANLNNNEVTAIDLSNEPDEIDSNKVLSPGVKLPLPHETNTKDKIKELEHAIATYSKMILELDEKEIVDLNDETCSPYIQSERYKTKVVNLYKELCKLTGTESVKRHKVRLKVTNGHPEGPVKCLEEFINSNIDKDGNPPFPDMHDVRNCVIKANILYKMGLSKQGIEQEAQVLFIHYGRTAQKRRMKREWRHLMTYVKEEAPDPADVDLTLQARLEQNSKIAKKNEDDLLDRFTKMESSSLPNTDVRLRIESDDSEHDSDSHNDSIPSVSNAPSEPIPRNECSNLNLNTYEESCSGNLTNNLIIYNPLTITAQYAMTYTVGFVNNGLPPVTPTAIVSNMRATEALVNDPETSKSNAIDTQTTLEVYSNNIVPVTNIVNGTTNLIASSNAKNAQANIQNGEISNTLESYGNSVNVNMEDRIDANTNIEVNENTTAVQVNKACESESTVGLSETSLNNTIIKREPLDIPKMLEELGDNFTTTIIDIEDPFLVVEISDSSDSEVEDTP